MVGEKCGPPPNLQRCCLCDFALSGIIGLQCMQRARYVKDENVCNSALAAHARNISVIGLVGLAIQQPVNSQFVKLVGKIVA